MHNFVIGTSLTQRSRRAQPDGYSSWESFRDAHVEPPACRLFLNLFRKPGHLALNNGQHAHPAMRQISTTGRSRELLRRSGGGREAQRGRRVYASQVFRPGRGGVVYALISSSRIMCISEPRFSSNAHEKRSETAVAQSMLSAADAGNNHE